VKGAQAHEIGATLFELDEAADHIDDVDAVEQVLLEGIRDHRGAIRLFKSGNVSLEKTRST
jgi:hypothetical protein